MKNFYWQSSALVPNTLLLLLKLCTAYFVVFLKLCHKGKFFIRITRAGLIRFRYSNLVVIGKHGGTRRLNMDQITVKTPFPKCRLYRCLIEFIDWRTSQSCWYFRLLLWTSAPLTFSLVHLPPPFPPFPVWINTGYVFIQCVTPQTIT
jgi:hypothetical protein